LLISKRKNLGVRRHANCALSVRSEGLFFPLVTEEEVRGRVGSFFGHQRDVRNLADDSPM